jgi:hypothetical protein
VTSASALVVNGKENAAVGTAGPAGTEGVLNIATVNSLTGAAVLSPSNAEENSTSVGLINVSDISGTRISGTTQTAVLLSTGTLSVYTLSNASADNARGIAAITVEGGTISSAFAADGLNSSRTVAVFNGATAGEAVAISPNAGATTMTVRLYNGSRTTYGSASDTAAATATAGSVPTLGTLEGQITVTIAAASVAGAIAASTSGVWYVASYNANNTATSDTANLGSANAVSRQYGAIRIRDAYRSPVAAGGLLQVSATNGARIALADSVGTTSTAFATNVADGQGFTVANPTNAPLSTTVTVTYNGTVIGTKTFSFWGEVARVVLADAFNGKQGVTSGNDVALSLFDAAGTPIYFIYNTSNSTFTPASGLISNAASDAVVAAHVAPEINAGVITPGVMEFACSATATKRNISVQYVNNSGTVITSNTLPVNCAGAAVTYKASYDKATYAPGEIAKLTIEFFDSKGNLANDVDAVAGSTAPVISLSGKKAAVIAPAVGNTQENGKLTYSYIVDTTEGTFTNTVVVANVNTAAGTAGVTATKAATVSLTVKAPSTGAVSNADVLKAIVSLIASINKQIAALQKALLRR